MQTLFTTGGVYDHKVPSFLSAQGVYCDFASRGLHPTNSSSDRNTALNELYQAISEQQTAHKDGSTILAGDLNHADIKTVLPKLHQHVDFPTRGDNILDLVYTTHKGAYKATPLPTSDSLTTLLLCQCQHTESESHQTGSGAGENVARGGLICSSRLL